MTAAPPNTNDHDSRNNNSSTTNSLHALLTPPPVPPYSARPFILVPLYIYPSPGAWTPLYTAADAHPELDFYVVVNPSNGPGDGVLPDANYAEALGRLTALRNVKVVGYVHCSYGKRPAEGIVEDVERYRGWEGESVKAGQKAIIIDGIFIDETPSSTEYVQYLAELSNAAKTILNRNILVPIPPGSNLEGAAQADATLEADDDNDDANETTATATTTATTGAEGAKAATITTATPSTPPPAQLPSGALTPSTSSAIVIYNPGVVVDPIFYQAADYVVAFENASAQWRINNTTPGGIEQGLRRLPAPLRQRSIPVAHSAGGGFMEVAQLSRRVAELGCLGLFVTSRAGYTEWCGCWAEFVREVARRTMI